MDGGAGLRPVFTPDPGSIARSQLTEFISFCEKRIGQTFSDYSRFQQFATKRSERFWGLFLEWSGLLYEGNPEPACTGRSSESARFFPNLRLGFVENLLRKFRPGETPEPALTAIHAEGPVERLSRDQLRQRTAQLAAGLGGLGVRCGDRAAAVVYNDADSVIAALAAAAGGAVFSACSPDMGSEVIRARFEPLAPTILLCHLRARPGIAQSALTERLAEVASGLSSLRAVVALDDGPGLAGLHVPLYRLREVIAPGNTEGFAPARLPFNHPLFVLFSSGTTGRPKCLIHGIGGTLIEHHKEHRLHCDLRPSDKMYFHTSAAWMMWHWQLSALACGTEIVLYDGAIRDAGTLWQLVARERVTVFGTSPAYLQLCEDARYEPKAEVDLSPLRAILSTGSILYDRQYDWVKDHVKALPLQSISGGTDIIGCFVLGNPNLPVYRGQIQCRSLGLDVQAQFAGESEKRRAVGELVCRNPFPSRPVGLMGDPDGSRFHAAYFSQNPGAWTHGDLIEFTPEGGARMHGRTDGTLNIRGTRVGPAEIYQILNSVREIRDAMAIEQRDEDEPGGSRMILFVVLRNGLVLDRALGLRIRKTLGSRGSSNHVPAVIAQVDDLPITHTGKRSERAATDAVNGRTVTNLNAIKNPASLSAMMSHPALYGRQRNAGPTIRHGSLETQLQAIWEKLFRTAPIEMDDNFFDLGGHSLMALRLLQLIAKLTGKTLVPAVLFEAPTIATLAAVLKGKRAASSATHAVPMKAGRGRPLFLIPGLTGTAFELTKLARYSDCGRPIYALQARGLVPGEQPHRSVGEAALDLVSEMRRFQKTGPYAIVGYSHGGLIAFEMARRLRSASEEVSMLALIDTSLHERVLPAAARLNFEFARAAHAVRKFAGLPAQAKLQYPIAQIRALADRLRLARGQLPHRPLDFEMPLFPELERVAAAGMLAYRAYVPSYYPGKISFFRALISNPAYPDPLPVWRTLARKVDVYDVAGSHREILQEPHVAELAAKLDHALSYPEMAYADAPSRASSLAPSPT